MSRVPGWRNGRREGLKILCQLNGVRVRVPLPALYKILAAHMCGFDFNSAGKQANCFACGRDSKAGTM